MSPSEVVAIATVLVQDAPSLPLGAPAVVIAAQALLAAVTDDGYTPTTSEQTQFDDALTRYQAL